MLDFEKVKRVLKENKESILEHIKEIEMKKYTNVSPIGTGYDIYISESDYCIYGPHNLRNFYNDDRSYIHLLSLNSSEDNNKDISLEQIEENCEKKEYENLIEKAMNYFNFSNVYDFLNKVPEEKIVYEILNISKRDIESEIIEEREEFYWIDQNKQHYSELLDKKLNEIIEFEQMKNEIL